MNAAGWYYAEGDPPGTTRYWDGERWVGDPQYSGPPQASGGYGAPTGRYTLANPGTRIGARVIDFIIAFVILLILAIPLISTLVDDIDALGPNPSDAQVERVFTDAFEDNATLFIVFAVVGLFWDFFWIGLFGGTPGKLILGLRVARADSGASPPGWGKAALRSLNRLVGLIPGFGFLIALLVGLVSLIMMFSDEEHRTVMDRVASTIVVRK